MTTFNFFPVTFKIFITILFKFLGVTTENIIILKMHETSAVRENFFNLPIARQHFRMRQHLH